MESKSPKEIQVEEKITDLVTKIVKEQTSGDDLPIRLWNSLRNHQEIAAIMTKGRARIPLEIPSKPAEGDIHKYSANAIDAVKIGRGNERPLKIEVHMRAEVGFFQVEEVLIPKIQSSPAKSLLELYAGVEGEEMKRYM